MISSRLIIIFDYQYSHIGHFQLKRCIRNALKLAFCFSSVQSEICVTPGLANREEKAPILTDQRLQNIGKLAQSKSARLELSVFDQAQFRISY